jgi:hypothetical protein
MEAMESIQYGRRGSAGVGQPECGVEERLERAASSGVKKGVPDQALGRTIQQFISGSLLAWGE